MASKVQRPPLHPKRQEYAIKTWRYLRLAMVALVAGLAASVVYEWSSLEQSCVQPSISAYYYTPVRGYFVGALLAIGVCLFCLKGSADVEDILLNLAGMFAPVVAFVPTTDKSACGAVLLPERDLHENIANNVTTLLAVGVLALAMLAILAVLARSKHEPPPTRTATVGFGVAVAIFVVVGLVFYVDRDLFVDRAHFVSAGLMFACILAVVCLNARGYKEKTGASSPRNRYGAIAAAMLVSVVVIPLVGLLGPWDHWVIVIEGVLIALFTAFWAIQTADLWDDGLR